MKYLNNYESFNENVDFNKFNIDKMKEILLKSGQVNSGNMYDWFVNKYPETEYTYSLDDLKSASQEVETQFKNDAKSDW
jgi:hypothetical protein